MRKLMGLGLVMLTGACAVGVPDGGSTTGGTEPEGVGFTDEATGERIEAFETLSFEGGAKVGFFEPSPGDLFVASWGPNEAPPAITKDVAQEDLLPLELYERLSGKSAPTSLVLAQSRALDAEALEGGDRGETRVQSTVERPSENGDEIRSKSAEAKLFDCQGTFSYDEWFNCNFCSGVGFDYTWMWSGGSGTQYQEDVTTYWSAVSAYAGNGITYRIRHRPWSSWSTRVSVSIAPGFYYSTSYRDTGTDYDLETKTLNASAAEGDGYHWCTNGWG